MDPKPQPSKVKARIHGAAHLLLGVAGMFVALYYFGDEMRAFTDKKFFDDEWLNEKIHFAGFMCLALLPITAMVGFLEICTGRSFWTLDSHVKPRHLWLMILVIVLTATGIIAWYWKRLF